MRIHSDHLSMMHIINALNDEKRAGRIDHSVTFRTHAIHGSRSHEKAFEIQLEASERNNGRRAGNSGSYGAMNEGDGYAATFDEWGWLLGALFVHDATMIVGNVKNPIYSGREDFDHKTALTYNPAELLRNLATGSDPYPIVTGQGSRTKRGYLIGRQGFGRVDTQPSHWPGKLLPRTAADVRNFAHLTEKD